jgi:cytoskeletal protein CcmA (bactofilin family)
VWRKQEEPKPSSSVPECVAPPYAPELRSQGASAESAAGGNLGKGLSIRGEIHGREDLFIDGKVQGKVQISEGSVMIGPNGQVTADIEAREILVLGRVEGALRGAERVRIGWTGEVVGDVATRRLAIEEGASLRGKVDVGRAEPGRSPRAGPREAAAEGLRLVGVSTKDGQS